MDNTENEAIRAFQDGGLEPEIDPMVEAIEKEIGKTLIPSEDDLALKDEAATGGKNEVFRAVNLTKSYGRGAAYIEVIKGISFSVEQGEYVVIVGPSGSGKSTLLHMLAGLEVPNRGEIRLRNHVIEKFTDDELAFYHREEIGLVFQNFNLLPSLNILENVAFPLMLAGAPLQWRQHEAYKMLDRFGMADFASHFPSQLSGGQQQRVSIARALVHDPELLLIDEPTGNLDSRSAAQVTEMIDHLHKQEDRTIILVTHSQAFLPYATRVFYIKDGTLLTSNEHHNFNPTAGSTELGLEVGKA